MSEINDEKRAELYAIERLPKGDEYFEGVFYHPGENYPHEVRSSIEGHFLSGARSVRELVNDPLLQFPSDVRIPYGRLEKESHELFTKCVAQEREIKRLTDIIGEIKATQPRSKT